MEFGLTLFSIVLAITPYSVSKKIGAVGRDISNTE